MKNIFLRHAVQEDVMFLFELVNEEECKKNSLKAHEITKNEHIFWFNEMMNSKTKKQYILMDGIVPVGQGRLETTYTGDACRISYSIIPEWRGHGYGKRLIQLLNNAAIKDFPNCIRSYGEVLKGNIVSQRIFEGLGYMAEERENFFYYYKPLEYYKTDQDVDITGVMDKSTNSLRYGFKLQKHDKGIFRIKCEEDIERHKR